MQTLGRPRVAYVENQVLTYTQTPSSFRMIMSVSLATGIFQDEVNRLLARQEETNKKDKVL
jgi:hypothetical protein